ncbi:SGNH/GDSL hydrolase family protein [Solicola gregarius]|uniref:SGNH/GDSL hydrolase family protein n=1 Tax=Solicola gregarius TaxID=2908642 RepID=A0AA46TJI2_9ACTN|nr:SGNH/GDSL hydrolase family protein [Solicola gregarius]UYM06466.1 SGNH/GDSL hydrolase family protein [Solicola gregarius]
MGTSRAAARRLATAAAYGGGSVGLLGGALWGVMKTEASLARKTIGDATGKPPSGDGVYGRELMGDVIDFAMLGDSAGAGYGVASGLDTPAALIGEALSNITGHPVRAACHAFVGAQTSDLDGQIDRALAYEPKVAAIVVGTNDVTHAVPPAESVRRLGAAVRRLRDAGCEVVVGTCPDLGTIEPLRQPLRSFARAWSRHLAARQTVAVVEAGGSSVSLGSLLGHDFAIAPDEFFSDDRFHPSETGYVSMVTAMLPAIARAGGVDDEDDEALAYTPGTVLPVSFAAKRAAHQSGTEVSGAMVGGRSRGPRGRWAAIRRLRG